MHRLARPFGGVLVAAFSISISISISISLPAWAGGCGDSQDPGKTAGKADANAAADNAPGGSLLGKRVVTKYTVPLKRDNGAVAEDDWFRVYTVEQVDGDRLRLSAEGISGWVDADDVVALDRAVAFYTGEIRHAPGNATAHLMRAYVRNELGDRARAIEDFNAAIALAPEEPTFRTARGLFHQESKDYPKAIADFTEAIRLDPKYALAIASRADVHNDAGELEKARDDYDRAIELEPRNPAHYSGRGTILVRLGEFERALEDLNRAIELDPRTGYYRFLRAWAYASLKDYDGALADYDEAIRLDPTDDFALRCRGWILATCPDPKYRDGKKAVESARKACERTKWNEPGSLSAMAAACAEVGDFDAAVKWQTKAIALYRDNEEQAAASQRRLKLYQQKRPYHEDEDSVIDH